MTTDGYGKSIAMMSYRLQLFVPRIQFGKTEMAIAITILEATVLRGVAARCSGIF